MVNSVLIRGEWGGVGWWDGVGWEDGERGRVGGWGEGESGRMGRGGDWEDRESGRWGGDKYNMNTTFSDTNLWSENFC